ncbi:GH11988 [Drosophila grimshawi]|uniref:GH11988 n=1 Tax=Drosophila grimshawi TaxID=7222 RepID=B4K3H1_DROGR|nr:GH11988 [Drosophila grimshawi]
MTENALEAFTKLKKALTSAPLLIHLDFKKPFFIQCDASHIGIGAVLFQLDEENAEHLIAFFSAKLRGAQLNYSVPEKECMAAVRAVEKFRAYVELMPFTIITDHASLQWLMSFKALDGRLARWSLTLQAYDFHIEPRKGGDNVVADMLSRPFDAEEADCFQFETTAFEEQTYLDRIKLVQQNEEKVS